MTCWYLVLSAILQPHVSLALSSQVLVITTYLLVGTGNALAHFTTPCKPGFMVACNLHFVYGLYPFKKWNFFNWLIFEFLLMLHT